MLDPRLRRRLDELQRQHHLPDEAVSALSALLDELLGQETLATASLPALEERRTPEPTAVEERYERLALLGRGGMGEVWRVRDRVLGRTLALKELQATGPGRRAVDLLGEARAAARLRHPAIVTVHDVGALPDGRLYYTMEEVSGRSLLEHVRALPSGSARHGPALRRLLDAVARVAQGLAYAHDTGIVHRDVKPQNIVLGAYGEVRLLDFGTGVLGTPAYLAPERARGEPASPASDQYSLGATLYHVLEGDPPFPGTSAETLERLRQGPHATAPSGPEELVGIVARAMHPDPAARYPSCAELADALLAHLDDARAEERALALVAEAHRHEREPDALRARAAELREAARQGLADVPLHAPVADKARWWALDDEATALDRRAAATEAEVLQLLRVAEREAPHLDAVHQALADHHQREHARRERAEDPGSALVLPLVRAHDRGRHAAYLRGEGRLRLRASPVPAEVLLFRVAEEGRRLVPRFERSLGPAPLDARVPVGRWIALLRAPGRSPVRLPLRVRRLEELDLDVFVPDGLGPDERYVPAGACVVGSRDRVQRDGMAPREVYVPGFILRRKPVTNAEYMTFLDALVADGRVDEALARAPGEGASRGVALRDGRFALVPDAEGHLWEPDWPVFQVDWIDASAFAAWAAERSGLPWRLPGELEWEKAARGADGRRYPWGERFEDTWCNMRSSRPVPAPRSVLDYPLDRGPYGVRGLAGNVADWCLDPFVAAGPPLDGIAWRPDAPAPSTGYRVVRGGAWSFNAAACATTYRLPLGERERTPVVGFRLARSVS